MRVDLKGMDARETADWLRGLGQEAYRARQIRQWLFAHLCTSFEEMSNLPKDLRLLLEEKAGINHLDKVETQISGDGTEKYLFQLADGHFIESVLIPERDHRTLCVSSQAGCAMGCSFCLTAAQGLKRNLRAPEIIEQVIQVKRSMARPDRLTNIVFMGMGEPLANYDEVKRAVVNLVSEDGMNFSKRRVTVSTCGLVPWIERLGREVKSRLAVSLNAADDETRNRIMPVNKSYPLGALMEACRNFPLRKGDRITFEYVLIRDVNDRIVDASRLVRLLSGLRAKINLIPLNPHEGTDMCPPSPDQVLRFQGILVRKHLTAMIRKSRGGDILAACGQLSGKRQVRAVAGYTRMP
jgi:23S rRNA (adenine2503-C2)-methyltransferase